MQIYTATFPWALPRGRARARAHDRTLRKLSQTMIQVYTIYEQRNPKNDERNYKYYVDIVSRPYRSFEIPFRRMQFGVFVGSFPFRYPSMMDYPITSGFFPPFFSLFFNRSLRADPVSRGIIIAVPAHARVPGLALLFLETIGRYFVF